MKREREYLGDSVYASFDGVYIWLTTDRDGVEHQIALDASAIAALLAYGELVGLRVDGKDE